MPLWLYWSGSSPAFDLDESFMRRWLYEIVLPEAARPEELRNYLDAGTLIALWPQLYLPRGRPPAVGGTASWAAGGSGSVGLTTAGVLAAAGGDHAP